MAGIPSDTLPGRLEKIRDEDFGYDQARHLLLRAGFGGTPQQIRTLAGWGVERAVDHLLEVERIPYEATPDQSFDRDIVRPFSDAERRAYRQAQRRGDEDTLARLRLTRQQMQRQDRRQIGAVQRWWLERMIETPRPLEEKMTLFWHGHFATSYRKVEDSFHMFQQNELFRAHALGNFGDLLFRIIRDPAMIRYLDNQASSAQSPNENLARELMELFSLGEGNYSERDIKEGARALTGYTYADDQFYFNAENHDRGGKRILGARGNLDGDGFVSAILGERNCADFIAGKLYGFFALHPEDQTATDEIGEAAARARRQLAAELLRARYDLRPVLRTLFTSGHFYHPDVVGRRIKSPIELVVGAIRTLNAPARDLGVLIEATALMGQQVMLPPSVAGWDGGRSWINTSTLFVRQNTMNFLLTGKLPAGYDALAEVATFDPWPLIEPLSELDPASVRDPEKVSDFLLRFTLGQSPQPARDALLAFAGEHDNAVTPDLVTGMLVLISAMPEYQLT
ncbi:MAG: DUF1800 domain-containing protein [Planctomycetota bacterium]